MMQFPEHTWEGYVAAPRPNQLNLAASPWRCSRREVDTEVEAIACLSLFFEPFLTRNVQAKSSVFGGSRRSLLLQWRQIRLQQRNGERIKAQAFAIGLAGALLLCPTLALAIDGTASVTDGDTLRVGGEVIRLHGIDAPEGDQTCRRDSGVEYDCGMAASRALANVVSRSRVSCEAKDKDQYGRTVAVCRVGSTILNELMVHEGHALAYRRYSEEYLGAEEKARSARRGMWAGQFMSPWEWRAQHRAAAPAQPTPQAGCPIKGNISSKSEKIFHVPGGRDYARTRISTEAGERWFCTEAEALRAGWRAAK